VTENEIQTPDFKIGNIPIFGYLALAPMDGLTDSPFRRIARQWGSAVCYTEFVNALDVLNHHPYLLEHIGFTEIERPLAIQIYDNDPDRLLSAAIFLKQFNPDFLDVNLGCSERSVSGRGAGAGLLREPAKIAQIFKTMCGKIDIPITAKIRLGWDHKSRNYLEIAHIIEDNGGQALAVHGRTKEQYFSGSADWDAIAEIKQAVKIPVIGNGDVRSAGDIRRLKEHTSCDGIMIGRAALGNPWIFSMKDRDEILPLQKCSTIHEHLENMIEFYGSTRGLILFRKHLTRYLSEFHLSPEHRKELMTTSEPSRCLELVDKILLEN
jgi:tRNA-dihydrouridine synthase B